MLRWMVPGRLISIRFSRTHGGGNRMRRRARSSGSPGGRRGASSEAPAIARGNDRSVLLFGPVKIIRRRGGRRMSNRRSRHERVGHDSEKYRMDEIVLDTVENICQVVMLLWFTRRGSSAGRNVSPSRPTHGHLDIDPGNVNTAWPTQFFCGCEQSTAASSQGSPDFWPLSWFYGLLIECSMGSGPGEERAVRPAEVFLRRNTLLHAECDAPG